MNDLLQKHGCANVFSLPEGLKELMSDITREVLREQPKNIYDFISNYLSVLLITREHGVMAVRILEELCDCRPSVSEHLLNLGLDKEAASTMANIIKDQIESFEATKDKDKIKESDILKKILIHVPLDEDMTAKVCQIVRNAYKDFVYKKNLLEQGSNMRAEEPWEVAAERTLALYKKTKPSLSELNRATERIQAAYKGYHVRRNLLKHLKPKKKRKMGPKEALPGPPLDIAGSREIDLGPVIDINVREDDINALFGGHATGKLGLHYDPKMTLKFVQDEKISEKADVSLSDHNPNDKGAGKYLTDQVDHSTNPEIRAVHVESRRDSRSCVLPGIMRHGVYNHEPLEHIPTDEDHAIEYRSVGTPARKISFSMVPPVLIPNDYPDEDQEVQEAIQGAFDEIAADTYPEIPEDIPDGDVEDGYSPVSSAASLVSTEVEEQEDLDREEN